MNHGVSASKRVHSVPNAHYPGHSLWPATNTIELEQEATTVKAIGHGAENDRDNDETGNGEVQAGLRPLAQMALGDGKDRDDLSSLSTSAQILAKIVEKTYE